MVPLNGPSVPSGLSKLTVPQLKALCKERRIAGYSKLGKAALLQRLAEVVPSTKSTSTPANDQTSPSGTATPATAPADETPAYTEPSTTDHRENSFQLEPVTPADTRPTATTSEKATLPTEQPQLLQDHVATNTGSASAQKLPSTKRPAHTDTSGPAKRTRTFIKSATANTTGHERPVPGTQQKLLANSSAVKASKVPVQHKQSFLCGTSTFAKQLLGISKSSAMPRQVTTGPGRFRPLVVSGPGPAELRQGTREPSLTLPISDIQRDSASFSGYQAMSLPALSHICFPPKTSERKWVYRWAIVLSTLSPTDMQTCVLVSRTFRYAVYLSAVHILSRSYPGRRLDIVLEQHTRNMTNFWPYLRLRMAEVSKRQHAFKRSFLGRHMNSVGYNPLSKHLWTSPDDEKQVDVAIRFTLTRMWFAVSVGAYGHDASAWSRCVVRDVREIVKGEIWQVIARDSGTGESCSFYVLEATCEVIGQIPSSQGENTLGYCLRADWTAWISQRTRAVPDVGPGSLLECVKWSNTEDYQRGISKVWLRRVQGQDANSIAKRNIAEKYILACVTANGISGQWMSTSAMAQEFAGLPSKDHLGSRTVGRSVSTVNMYLPAHHHIESVHFTTSKGEVLHGEVAVVQTPGREYYVLRDNGMQVGCEEEGIPEVWQRILGCDAVGRAH